MPIQRFSGISSFFVKTSKAVFGKNRRNHEGRIAAILPVFPYTQRNK
jgi:hypothetical protein